MSVTVQLDRLGFTYPGAEAPTLSDVQLDFAPKEFVALVGASGCGKSTLLRLLAGLEQPTEGRILFDDQDVSRQAPKARDVAMVFQSYALYPHMTVAENLGFPLRVAGESATTIDQRVRQIAETLELSSLLDRRPGALSGGQRQRVAIGRAMVRKPRLFLFDEPLSNLDAGLRNQMRAELAQRHRAMGVTSVYVTHDQVEAMTLADRVALLRGGKIEQFDTPEACFERPRSAYVASFFGQPPAALLPGSVHGEALQLGAANLPIDVPMVEHSGDVIVGLRSRALQLAADGPLRMTISEREFTGAETRLHGTIEGLPDTPLCVTTGSEAGLPGAGETMNLTLRPGSLLLFHRDNELTLRTDHR